ncbi:MAG: prolyl oligopeptidase family serine peptidase [Pseudomonadota bacterium]|jgi:predicted peptidase
MRRWVLALVALFMLAAPSVVLAETGFLDRTVRVEGRDYAYQVYVPRKPIAGRKPIILALHGAGERGSDGLLQTEVGLAGAIRRNPDRWPAIVVFPQAPAGQLWAGAPAQVAMAALAAAEREFSTDPDRVYLAGLSMGGNGTWRLAYENPRRFAAIVPVCGFAGAFRGLPPIAAGPDPYAALAQRIAHLPTWIVHGDADSVVPVDESRKMAAALQAAGAKVTYKELAGVNHNSWDPGFRDEALPVWLFQQRRTAGSPSS